MNSSDLSIILPAKNEAQNLEGLLSRLITQCPEAEIIVVDDGSTDGTRELLSKTEGVRCISHPVSIGNGGAIKTGARSATRPILVFMDADGQHQPEEIENLLNEYRKGFDMIVGSRSDSGQASRVRLVGNRIYNGLASIMTGFKIEDLTSGFRLANRKKFLKILYLLPNKFSYPTTSTMAFFRMGYFLGYVPINVSERGGESHIRVIRDGLKFLIIILKIGTLYSPMRLFLPISFLLFSLSTFWYIVTYFSVGRFTNMSMLLYMSSLLTFLIGIVAEQVSSLHYKDTERGDD